MRRTSNSSTADLHVEHQPVLSIVLIILRYENTGQEYGIGNLITVPICRETNKAIGGLDD